MQSTLLIQPAALGELAYEAIRDLVIDGVVDPDERLVETMLTSRLGTSRTPVREALARLASEGLLLAGPNGYRVPRVKAEDIVNMSEVRALLEPEAARQAAANRDDIGIDGMRAALADAGRAHATGDGTRVALANQAYRVAWLTRVRNPMLLQALAKVMSSLQLIRQRTMADAVLRGHIIDMQAGLLELIERRDPDAAAAWQRDHVRSLGQLLLDRLYADHGAESVA
jgi:DNA-binding GntR family transcriptional regulator